MSKKQLKRVNKSKKEIVSNIQLTQDAERARSIIREILFPYIRGLDENVAYTKLFLQSFSGLIEGIFDNQRKSTTLGDLMPDIKIKLDSLFSSSDLEQKKEYDRYMGFVEVLKDVSVFDMSRATELPRLIDGFLVNDKNKESIHTIPLEKILG